MPQRVEFTVPPEVSGAAAAKAMMSGEVAKIPKYRILVVDLSPGSRLASEMKEILESCARLGLVAERVFAAFGPEECDEGRLAELALQSSPDLWLFLVPADPRVIVPLLHLAAGINKGTPIAVLVEEPDPAGLIELLRVGASDFFIPPLRAIDVFPRLTRLLEQTHRNKLLVETMKEQLGLKRLIGESPAFLAEIKKIPLISKCGASVLILGETGTGKEVCARAIHYLSPQTDKPFVPINCGAIPVELVENELFGHQGGAFTGARASQQGLIEEADGGTLFLDEVDCLPMLAQVKLLRFLHDGEYRPLGSTKARRAVVRIIAATNVDLEKAVDEGKLRRDLYYRLNIVQLTLPPLRERADDIPLLARHFLATYASEFGKKIADFAPDALQRLAAHDWPGNVRELEHAVQRAVVLSEHNIIHARDLSLPSATSAPPNESLREAKARVVGQFEKSYIKSLLRAYRGNITRAAQAAGKNRRAFWQLIRKYRIDVESLKSKTASKSNKPKPEQRT